MDKQALLQQTGVLHCIHSATGIPFRPLGRRGEKLKGKRGEEGGETAGWEVRENKAEREL